MYKNRVTKCTTTALALLFSVIPIAVFAEDVSSTSTQMTITSETKTQNQNLQKVEIKTSFDQPSLLIKSATVNCSIQKGILLKKGSKGKNVVLLQNSLIKQGYLKVSANGYFGVATLAAVKLFQKDHKFTVTGIVGPYTLATLNDLSCGTQSAESLTSLIQDKKSSSQIDSSFGTKQEFEQDSLSSSNDRPSIALFSVLLGSSGTHLYTAKITNADSVSVKADCPLGVVEVKSLVGFTKTKIEESDSVCKKEKYLLLNNANQTSVFERVNSEFIFTDRDGVASWFAFDASTTPIGNTVTLLVKACHAATCTVKYVFVNVGDYYKKIATTDLGLSDVRVDSKQNLYLVANNVNKVTVRAGCPYNTQAVDSSGAVLQDDATPCNVEKSLLETTSLTSEYSKKDGVPLKDFGFTFEMRPINGQTDPYSNIELTVKACSGIQADTISSTTLRCIEKATYLPVYQKNK